MYTAHTYGLFAVELITESGNARTQIYRNAHEPERLPSPALDPDTLPAAMNWRADLVNSYIIETVLTERAADIARTSDEIPQVVEQLYTDAAAKHRNRRKHSRTFRNAVLRDTPLEHESLELKEMPPTGHTGATFGKWTAPTLENGHADFSSFTQVVKYPTLRTCTAYAPNVTRAPRPLAPITWTPAPPTVSDEPFNLAARLEWYSLGLPPE